MTKMIRIVFDRVLSQGKSLDFYFFPSFVLHTACAELRPVELLERQSLSRSLACLLYSDCALSGVTTV